MPSSQPVMLLIGTRKGGFILRGTAGRSAWQLLGPFFLGSIINHVVVDPRDGRTMLAAARTGHLGPTVFRSTDFGETWQEAERPPAFPKAAEGEEKRSLSHVFWLSPGHPSQPDVWYAGSSPPGLFRSQDGGRTWDPVPGFNQHPMYRTWVGGPQDAPPGGATLHSILIDPRDPRHMYFGVSTGGVFETTDAGEHWGNLNRGLAGSFLADPQAEFGHDPHRVALHPLRPDRLYQQNHEGIYRMERAEGRWLRIGDNMPRDVGDVGFPIVLHPRDPDSAWVFPMDASDVWPRTSPGGRPSVFRTSDAGATWQRLDEGLPRSQAYFTVKRQAMAVDGGDPLGVYFATTNGEVWGSSDEGRTWACLARYLPEVYSLEVTPGAD